MRYSFKIGSAWGIPIELHFTFILLIAAVFVLSLPTQQFYIFFLVLFLFIFVVFHELAHSVIARHYGINVRKIILYPIGGVSEIEEIPDNPSQEWRMAIAGPLTSLLIGAVLLGISLLISPQTSITLAVFFTTTGNFLFDFATLNILLGVFNLVPAFPMDGGRVFRALLAERMKFSDATRYAVYLGRIFGIIMVVVGFIFNFFLILVGIFVYIGASEEAEQTIISTTLAGVRAKDVMQSEVGSVNPQQSLTEALEVMFKNRYHDVLVEEDGVFQGVVTWNELMKIKPEDRSKLRVEQMPLKNTAVYEDESILEVNKIMTREKIDLVPVVDREMPTKIVGVLTSEAIANAYEKSKSR
jgi:Zn-dependent protease/CBS domain-containing protein